MNEQINLIWIGDTAPILIQSNLKKWQDVYGSRVKVWDNQSVQTYTKNLDALGFHPAKLADICRVFILNEFGGWYVDADMEPGNTQLERFMKTVLFKESKRCVMNGLMHIPKDSYFSTVLLDEIKASLSEDYGSIALQTGPMALVRAIYRFSLSELLTEVDKVEILPECYIKSAKFKRSSLFSNSNKYLTIDHSLNSWAPSNYEKMKINPCKRLYQYFSRIDGIISLYEILKYVLIPMKLRSFLSCHCNRLVFFNCQYFQLESWEQLLVLHYIEDVNHSLMRDINIMKVITKDLRGDLKLNSIGWQKCKKHNCYIRPNVTKVNI